MVGVGPYYQYGGDVGPNVLIATWVGGAYGWGVQSFFRAHSCRDCIGSACTAQCGTGTDALAYAVEYTTNRASLGSSAGSPWESPEGTYPKSKAVALALSPDGSRMVRRALAPVLHPTVSFAHACASRALQVTTGEDLRIKLWVSREALNPRPRSHLAAHGVRCRALRQSGLRRSAF